MTGGAITGLGSTLPDKTLDNAELGSRFGVEPSWIYDRTGIRTRRIAAAGDTVHSLGARAATAALAAARRRGNEIDLVVCATITAERRIPSTACLIQHAVGARGPAFDLNAGCSGFLYALALADSHIRAGAATRALVVGSETLSRITDEHDKQTAILFGDGAGAAVVERTPGRHLGPFVLSADGSRPELLHTSRATDKIQMAGRDVYRAAVTKMSEAIGGLFAREHVRPEHVALVVLHQANARIVEAVRARLGLPSAKMFTNIERTGNTSAASIPLALHDALESGALEAGDRVVLAAFGAGFTWGAGLVRWTAAREHPATLAEAVLAGV